MSGRRAVDELFYGSGTGHGASAVPGATRAQVRAAEATLGVTLPASYIDLVMERNGGYLRYDGILLAKKPPEGLPYGRLIGVGSIAGVGEGDGSIEQLSTLARGEWGVRDTLVAFDGDGHWWIGLDYNSCGPDGEPAVTLVDTEIGGEIAVAKSFGAFLDALVRSSFDAIFAVIEPGMGVSDVDALLRGTGWSRKKGMRQWQSAKFRSGPKGEDKALANLFANAGEDGRISFTELPGDTPLLHVYVSEKDHAACVRELSAVFGSRARLMHEPLDRPQTSLADLPRVKVKPVATWVEEGPAFNIVKVLSTFRNGDEAGAIAFMDQGLDPCVPLGPGLPLPMREAVVGGHASIVRMALDRTKARPPFKGDAMLAAAQGGRAEILKMLIDAGEEPAIKHLREAAEWTRPDTVQVLIEAGVKPTARIVNAVPGVYSDDPEELKRMQAERARTLRLLGADPDEIDRKEKERYDAWIAAEKAAKAAKRKKAAKKAGKPANIPAKKAATKAAKSTKKASAPARKAGKSAKR